MSTLHATINDLAERFAHELLRALRGASLEEIIRETAPGHGVKRGRAASGLVASSPRGGRVRRSSDELNKLVQRIVVAVRAAGKKGISAEALRAELGVQRKLLPRPLGMALASKRIRKTGVKRSTTYFGA